MKYPTRALCAISVSVSLFVLMASAASAAPGTSAAPTTSAASTSSTDPLAKTVTDFYSSSDRVNPPSIPCPGPSDLPDAPTPKLRTQHAQNASKDESSEPVHQSTFAKVLTKVKFLSSTCIGENPTTPGQIGICDGYLGVTFGDVQISKMLAQSGIPNTPDTKVLFNVTVGVSPTATGLNIAAEAAAESDIKKYEAGLPWQQKDLNSAKSREKALQKDGLRTVTVSAAVITPDGKLYTCEVGKAPVTLIPNDSPDGATNSIENATGGPNDALRVGSSYSTPVGKCTFAKSIGKDSKFQLGIKAYKNTLPYKDTNTTIANEYFENQTGFKANRSGNNAVVLEGEYAKKINDNTSLKVNGAIGETLNKPIYSASGSLTTGRNTVSAATSEGHYTSMSGSVLNDPTSPNYTQTQKGTFVSDSFRFYKGLAVVGTAAWNKGVADSGQAKTVNGVANYNEKTFGLEYGKTLTFGKPNSLVHSQGVNHIYAGAALQNISSPDGSLPGGNSLVGHFRITTDGDFAATLKAFKELLPAKKVKAPSPADTDVAPDATNAYAHAADPFKLKRRDSADLSPEASAAVTTNDATN